MKPRNQHLARIDLTIWMYRGVAVDDVNILNILSLLSHIPQATKAWKPYVSDVLDGPAALDLEADQRHIWIRLFASLMMNDKDKIQELLGESDHRDDD